MHLFLSLHPNLVTSAAHRIYRRSSIGGDFLQLQGGGGAAQVVDVGIIRKGDETIGFYHLQGTGDALFPGIELLAKLMSFTPTLRYAILSSSPSIYVGLSSSKPRESEKVPMPSRFTL